MKSKYVLFTGIILLSTGIYLRATNHLKSVGLILIIIGALCKLLYIIKKVQNGTYKPGKELFVLGLGLILLFIGVYGLDPTNPYLKPIYFISLGIALKIIFVIWFISKIRFQGKTN